MSEITIVLKLAIDATAAQDVVATADVVRVDVDGGDERSAVVLLRIG
jgi:hypothetical protein